MAQEEATTSEFRNFDLFRTYRPLDRRTRSKVEMAQRPRTSCSVDASNLGISDLRFGKSTCPFTDEGRLRRNRGGHSRIRRWHGAHQLYNATETPDLSHKYCHRELILQKPLIQKKIWRRGEGALCAISHWPIIFHSGSKEEKNLLNRVTQHSRFHWKTKFTYDDATYL